MIKYLSLFSGIGGFEKGLSNIGVQYELVGFSEINKYTADSYCAIHSIHRRKNLGDIELIDEKLIEKDIDIITYGFPCINVSKLGKMDGFKKKNQKKTKSGLVEDGLRIIREVQPKVAIAENVTNLIGRNMWREYKYILDELNKAGYNNYCEVLNSKDFGLPHSRGRLFIVSIRKDIDDKSFSFPEKIELTKGIIDILDSSPSKGLLLKNSTIESYLSKSGAFSDKFEIKSTDSYASCLTTKGAYRAITNNYVFFNIDTYEQCDQSFYKNLSYLYECGIQIRGLSTLEYFKLQGFTSIDHDLAMSVCSHNQLYEQAGNAVSVNVAEAIFRQIFSTIL